MRASNVINCLRLHEKKLPMQPILYIVTFLNAVLSFCVVTDVRDYVTLEVMSVLFAVSVRTGGRESMWEVNTVVSHRHRSSLMQHCGWLAPTLSVVGMCVYVYMFVCTHSLVSLHFYYAVLEIMSSYVCCCFTCVARLRGINNIFSLE